MEGFLESMAVGQTFATKFKYDIDANQEFMAIGLANIVGAFFQGFPSVGSFSRTAVNGNSGAKSTIANGITGLVVMLALIAMAPMGAFLYLPYSALASMIMVSIPNLIDIQTMKHAWQASRPDFYVMFATTFIVIALGVKEGLFVGFVASIVANLNASAYPNLAELGVHPTGGLRNLDNYSQAEWYPGILIVRVDARMFFANTSVIRQWVLKRLHLYNDGDLDLDSGDNRNSLTGKKGENPQLEDRLIHSLVFDMRGTNSVDLSGLHMLEGLSAELQTFTGADGQQSPVAIYFGNTKYEVNEIFQSAQLVHHMYPADNHGDHVFRTMEEAIRKAMAAKPPTPLLSARDTSSSVWSEHGEAVELPELSLEVGAPGTSEAKLRAV